MTMSMPVTDTQIRELRARESSWLATVDLTTRANHDEYHKHLMSYYHASVALGIRRARRGGSRARSRAYCETLINNVTPSK